MSTDPGGATSPRIRQTARSTSVKEIYEEEEEDEIWPSDSSLDGSHARRRRSTRHSIESRGPQYHVTGRHPAAYSRSRMDGSNTAHNSILKTDTRPSRIRSDGSLPVPLNPHARTRNQPPVADLDSTPRGRSLQDRFQHASYSTHANTFQTTPDPINMAQTPNPYSTQPNPPAPVFSYPAWAGTGGSTNRYTTSLGDPSLLPTHHPSIQVPYHDYSTPFIPYIHNEPRYRDIPRPQQPSSMAAQYNTSDQWERISNPGWNEDYQKPEKMDINQDNRRRRSSSTGRYRRGCEKSESRKVRRGIKKYISDELRKQVLAFSSLNEPAIPASFDRNYREREHRILLNRVLQGGGAEDLRGAISSGHRRTSDLAHIADVIELVEELEKRKSYKRETSLELSGRGESVRMLRTPPLNDELLNTIMEAVRQVMTKEAREWHYTPGSQPHAAATSMPINSQDPTQPIQEPTGFQYTTSSQPFVPKTAQSLPQHWHPDACARCTFAADAYSTTAQARAATQPHPPISRAPAYIFLPPGNDGRSFARSEYPSVSMPDNSAHPAPISMPRGWGLDSGPGAESTNNFGHRDGQGLG